MSDINTIVFGNYIIETFGQCKPGDACWVATTSEEKKREEEYFKNRSLSDALVMPSVSTPPQNKKVKAHKAPISTPQASNLGGKNLSIPKVTQSLSNVGLTSTPILIPQTSNINNMVARSISRPTVSKISSNSSTDGPKIINTPSGGSYAYSNIPWRKMNTEQRAQHSQNIIKTQRSDSPFGKDSGR